jgi:hypothetical protein
MQAGYYDSGAKVWLENSTAYIEEYWPRDRVSMTVYRD